MAFDIYRFVIHRESSERQRITLGSKDSQHKLFQGKARLESFAIDILCPSQTTLRENRYLSVIIDRFSKLSNPVPLVTQDSLATARAFRTHSVFNYGTLHTVLSDSVLTLHRSSFSRSDRL